jgi:hypothetical protein
MGSNNHNNHTGAPRAFSIVPDILSGMSAHHYPGPADWLAAVRRRTPRLDRAAQLVVGQLADRADTRGRVRVSVGALAASACLHILTVNAVLAVLIEAGLLERATRGDHILLVPDVAT